MRTRGGLRCRMKEKRPARPCHGHPGLDDFFASCRSKASRLGEEPAGPRLRCEGFPGPSFEGPGGQAPSPDGLGAPGRRLFRAAFPVRTNRGSDSSVTRAQTFPDDFAPAAGFGGEPLPPSPASAGRSGRLGQATTPSDSLRTCQEHFHSKHRSDQRGRSGSMACGRPPARDEGSTRRSETPCR